MRFRKNKRRRRPEPQSPLSSCAWCKEHIAPDAEVFSVGAKARPGIDLSEQEGQTIPLPLPLVRKIVPAIVVPGHSEAKQNGYDLVFMVCSQECGNALREALTEELQSGA